MERCTTSHNTKMKTKESMMCFKNFVLISILVLSSVGCLKKDKTDNSTALGALAYASSLVVPETISSPDEVELEITGELYDANGVLVTEEGEITVENDSLLASVREYWSNKTSPKNTIHMKRSSGGLFSFIAKSKPKEKKKKGSSLIFETKGCCHCKNET